MELLPLFCCVSSRPHFLKNFSRLPPLRGTSSIQPMGFVVRLNPRKSVLPSYLSITVSLIASSSFCPLVFLNILNRTHCFHPFPSLWSQCCLLYGAHILLGPDLFFYFGESETGIPAPFLFWSSPTACLLPPPAHPRRFRSLIPIDAHLRRPSQASRHRTLYPLTQFPFQVILLFVSQGWSAIRPGCHDLSRPSCLPRRQFFFTAIGPPG